MKSKLIAAMVLLPAASFCQYTYSNLQVNFLEKDQLARSYTYQNLRLYPIHSKQSFVGKFKGVGNYLPIQDALQNKKIRVTEKSDGGEVSSLVIENISKDTIIIISGDIVKGGKQDRIIQEDIVLKPN